MGKMKAKSEYWKSFIFVFILAMAILQGFKPLLIQAAETTDTAYDDEDSMQQIDGWYYEAGKTYYFISGEKQTGIQEVGNKTYYFLPSTGEMQKGLLKIDGDTYYFSPKTGSLRTGWVKAGKRTYYAGRKGILRAGWKKLDGKTYYFSTKNNDMQTGWTTVGGKHYYFAASGKQKGVLQKNCIAGTSKAGLYYVDHKGVRVTSSEIMNAVQFVQKYAAGASTAEEKLRQCFIALQSYPYLRTSQDFPSAGNMSSYANDMFTRGQGNCYRYAASFACVAKVLGFPSRVGVGGVSSRGPGTSLSPHGWAEVKAKGKWGICDISMQRHHPEVSLYLCAMEKYPFRISCNVRYTLTFKNGEVSWK